MKAPGAFAADLRVDPRQDEGRVIVHPVFQQVLCFDPRYYVLIPVGPKKLGRIRSICGAENADFPPHRIDARNNDFEDRFFSRRSVHTGDKSFRSVSKWLPDLDSPATLNIQDALRQFVEPVESDVNQRRRLPMYLPGNVQWKYSLQAYD